MGLGDWLNLPLVRDVEVAQSAVQLLLQQKCVSGTGHCQSTWVNLEGWNTC